MRRDAGRSGRGGVDSLCRACAAASGCSFLGAVAQPVRSCVRFRGAGDGAAHAPGGALPRSGSGSRTAPGVRGYRGPAGSPPADRQGSPSSLCPGCRNRADCMYPRGGGGVWYCGDYA